MLLILTSIFYMISNKKIVLNSNFPLKYEDKIDDLISKMTLEEKVGQTCQITLDAFTER